MGDPVERPVFSEGQILGAADLEAVVEHARGRAARHERYLHTGGIASGLKLEGVERQAADGRKYETVTLSAGVAIDGRGREIIVPEPVRLSEDQFNESFVAQNDDAARYPVFLIGLDQQSAPPPLAVGGCATTAQATRAVEGYELRFGRPGDESDPEPPAPDVSSGPGDVTDGAWPVLVGFVKWGKDIEGGKFTGRETESAGIGVRYAGVHADEVASRGTRLLLHTGSKRETGKPALALDEAEGGELKFGFLNDVGQVNPVLFTVSSKGDLTAVGKISGALASGSVYVQSGIATDGVVLPLPPGVAEEQVGPGKAVLHVSVNLRPRGTPPPDTSTTTWVALPLECEVGDDRRVSCRVAWYGLNGPGIGQVHVGAGACDYFLLVAVPAAEGGGA
jgi:hypothetical protein